MTAKQKADLLADLEAIRFDLDDLKWNVDAGRREQTAYAASVKEQAARHARP